LEKYQKYLNYDLECKPLDIKLKEVEGYITWWRWNSESSMDFSTIVA
jgi:hypothetical protein